jgi:hypothetical protein
MNRCQICKEPIWTSISPGKRGNPLTRFVCFYCFNKLRNGKYKPTLTRDENILVCDKCGQVSDDVRKSDSGLWVCGDCAN